MRNYFYVFLCLILTGCATVDSETIFIPIPMDEVDSPKENLTNIDQVKTGMAYKEVMELMGNQVQIGYQEGDASAQSVGAVALRNPFRIEMLTVNEIPHLVVFYLTKVNNSDGEVTDDELTPVVFKDNVMLGKGWTFLESLKSK